MTHEHNRDDDGQPTAHSRRDDNSMPEILKWSANFIQRVGFPIFMCCILAYVLLVVVDKNTKAVGDLRVAIVQLTERIEPYKAVR